MLFFEEQRFPQVAVTLFLCGIGALEILFGLFLLVFAQSLFSRPQSTFLFCCELALIGLGTVLVALRFAMRLRVIVDFDGIRAGIHPMPLNKYSWKLFSNSKVRTYRAFTEHGGRGSVRLRDGTGWAYTAWGDRGVALKLTDGQTLFIGSQNPGELCAAIREALASAASAVVKPPEGSPTR